MITPSKETPMRNCRQLSNSPTWTNVEAPCNASIQAIHLKPHGLESWHQDCQNSASSTKVHRLGADAGVQATDALGGVELGSLPEERSWVVWGQGRGARDRSIKGVGERLLLNDRTANVRPAIEGDARGACKEARDDVTSESFSDNGRDHSLVHVKRHEEASRPQALPDLHASIARHEAAEASGFHDVTHDISGSLKLAIFVELCSELDVLKRRNGEDLRDRGHGTCDTLGHWVALGIWHAEHPVVHNWEHEELHTTRNGGPRHFCNQALPDKAHHAVRLKETFQSCTSTCSGVRHANRTDDVNWIHRYAG